MSFFHIIALFNGVNQSRSTHFEPYFHTSPFLLSISLILFFLNYLINSSKKCIETARAKLDRAYDEQFEALEDRVIII